MEGEKLKWADVMDSDEEEEVDDGWSKVEKKEERIPPIFLKDKLMTCDACGEPCHSLKLSEPSYGRFKPLCQNCQDNASGEAGEEKDFPLKCECCSKKKFLLAVHETNGLFKIVCYHCNKKTKKPAIQPAKQPSAKETSAKAPKAKDEKKKAPAPLNRFNLLPDEDA